MTMGSWTERVVLRHAGPSPLTARLREPSGGDELSLAGVDTRAAVAFLDRLVDAPGGAAQLSASDRDALLAAVHRALWGDHIVSSLQCPACRAMYDLSFELSSLQRKLLEQTEPIRLDAPRSVHTAYGEHFSLPSADEEQAAADLGAQEGAARLRAAVSGQGFADADVLGGRLEAIAPLLDVDLSTTCAECGHAGQARFDVQSFVLQRLLDEREAVLDEVHALGRAYGWALSDILALPRGMRRALVQRATAVRSTFA